MPPTRSQPRDPCVHTSRRSPPPHQQCCGAETPGPWRAQTLGCEPRGRRPKRSQGRSEVGPARAEHTKHAAEARDTLAGPRAHTGVHTGTRSNTPADGARGICAVATGTPKRDALAPGTGAGPGWPRGGGRGLGGTARARAGDGRSLHGSRELRSERLGEQACVDRTATGPTQRERPSVWASDVQVRLTAPHAGNEEGNHASPCVLCH